jgi:hypothetical protein
MVWQIVNNKVNRMAQVKLMTQAEYAKHRGVSAVAVHKAVAAGRISTIDGKIDPAVASIQWAANTRARAPTKRPESPTQPPASESAPPAADDPAPGVKADDYWDARSRRETAEAAIAEMKEAEMRGTLIRADAARAAWATKVTAARDALLQIPSRLAPVLAAEADMERVTELLEGELRAALLQLSDSRIAEVAS